MTHTLQTDGGISMLLEAIPLMAWQHVTSDQIEETRSILESRLKGIEILDPVVKVEGAGRIRVEAPGISDLANLRAAMEAHMRLEWVDGGDDPPTVGSHITTDFGSPLTASSDGTGSVERVWHTVLSDADVAPGGVQVTKSPTGSPDIRITFTKAGAQKLADFTTDNVREYMPIVLDKQVVSVPLIIDPMKGGEASITTQNIDQAIRLFVHLKYGPLPVSLKDLEATVVPPRGR